MKLKCFMCLVGVILFGCGPYSVKSFKPDSKIRSDYLNDSISVSYKIYPNCKQSMALLVYWSMKCSEPYSLQISFSTKRNTGPISVIPKSVKVKAGRYESDVLRESLRGKPIILETKSNGSLEAHIDLDLGRLVHENIKTFSVSTSYAIFNSSDSSTAEKEFYFFRTNEWQARFGWD